MVSMFCFKVTKDTVRFCVQTLDSIVYMFGGFFWFGHLDTLLQLMIGLDLHSFLLFFIVNRFLYFKLVHVCCTVFLDRLFAFLIWRRRMIQLRLTYCSVIVARADQDTPNMLAWECHDWETSPFCCVFMEAYVNMSKTMTTAWLLWCKQINVDKTKAPHNECELLLHAGAYGKRQTN